LELPETSGFLAFLGFLSEAQNLVDYFDVGQQHTSATVPFNAQAVQDILGILAGSNSPSEFFPFVAHEFAAGEAPHGDNHCFWSPVYL
jgi:hypothetical protein